MEIRKFDRKTDNIGIVADLILRAYSQGEQNLSYDENSKQIVQDFVETGNNFIGHENIYICLTDNLLAGLVIGYTGKSYSKVKTLFDLLFKLKLTQLLNYLIISSQLFDSSYTPYLEEDEFYISVIVVDEKCRNQGIGTYLLKEIIMIAKEKGCKKIILDVDKGNTRAQSLYKKFGFKIHYENRAEAPSKANENNHTMVYSLGED